MKKMFSMMTRWIFLLALLAFGSNAAAVTKDVPLESLKPGKTQRQTALIVNRVLGKYHYKKVSLDDDLSERIFDKYLDSLDPNKSFFTRGDILEFEKYRHKLDDAIAHGWLDPAYEIFRRFRQRVDQQVAWALTLLEKNDFDFTRPERYRFDREEADWAEDEEALKALWRKRVKNDILSLRLAGKPEEKIRETLRKRYENLRRRIHQLDADDVFQTFLNAYTLSIEPHTAYMSPARSENFDISMRLSLQGIGAVLTTKDEYTKIQKIIPGGPADKSGQLKPGDLIVGVAQGNKGEMEDVIGWPLQDVVEKIRGPKGTVVRLSILPKSAGPDGATREVAIVRDKIKLEDQAAKSQIIEVDGLRFGVIELPAFYRDFRGQAAGNKDFRSTTRDVRKLIAKFKEEKVDGIIMDLRNNGGGSLTEAVELTGLFIPYGPVVQVKDSHGRLEVEQDTDPELVYDGPLAVLVNRNSASASEIFAAAIQDYGRGLVVGEPTYGKGTVQTLVDLNQFSRRSDDLGRLRLTIAQFFRIQGGSTQNKGVIPDLVFPTAPKDDEHGERSLDNALPWTRIEPVDHHLLGKVDVAALEARHRARIAQDPGFEYLVGQAEAFRRMADRKEVSLVEAERKKEWDERERAALERRNKLRAARGLPPLEKLEEDDEEENADKEEEDDPEGIDRIMLEETAHILADYIRLKEPVARAAGLDTAFPRFHSVQIGED